MELRIFWNPDRETLAQSRHAIAIYDGYPVSKGHALVVPRRHVTTIWDLEAEEYAACFELVRSVRRMLASQYSPDGFNVGVNRGEAAGQSVARSHIHLIPRYRGDVPQPRGDVRNVIPHKGHY